MQPFDNDGGIFIMLMGPDPVASPAQLKIKNREICLSLFKQHFEALFQCGGINQFRGFEVRLTIRHQRRLVTVKKEVVQRKREGMDAAFFQFGIEVMGSGRFTGAGRTGEQDNFLLWELAGEAVSDFGDLLTVTFFR